MEHKQEIKYETDKSAEAIQHILGSINLDDIKKIDGPMLTDAELDARAGDAEIFYMKHFENVIKLFIQEQLKYIAEQAQNESQLVFGRGTINGLYLIDEWFKQRVAESRSRFQKEEKPEPGEIL